MWKWVDKTCANLGASTTSEPLARLQHLGLSAIHGPTLYGQF